jgi:hypothetical protein
MAELAPAVLELACRDAGHASTARRQWKTSTPTLSALDELVDQNDATRTGLPAPITGGNTRIALLFDCDPMHAPKQLEWDRSANSTSTCCRIRTRAGGYLDWDKP